MVAERKIKRTVIKPIKHLLNRIVVPSESWLLPRNPKKHRLLAVASFRNETRFLQGFLKNVSEQVDGIVALDDGSTDNTFAILNSNPAVLDIIRIPSDRALWDEPGNYQKLVQKAIEYGAEWILSVDADERLEHGFRVRAERLIRLGNQIGLSAYRLKLRELWETPNQYRIDGIWGRKFIPRLFRSHPNNRFEDRALHASKAPLQSKILGRYIKADLIIYHLRMINAADRVQRQKRYKELDPNAEFQPHFGYDYLTDETALKLSKINSSRHFRHV